MDIETQIDRAFDACFKRREEGHDSDNAINEAATELLEQGENGEDADEILEIVLESEATKSELWRFMARWDESANNGAARTAIASGFAAMVASWFENAAAEVAERDYRQATKTYNMTKYLTISKGK